MFKWESDRSDTIILALSVAVISAAGSIGPALLHKDPKPTPPGPHYEVWNSTLPVKAGGAYILLVETTTGRTWQMRYEAGNEGKKGIPSTPEHSFWEAVDTVAVGTP